MINRLQNLGIKKDTSEFTLDRNLLEVQLVMNDFNDLDIRTVKLRTTLERIFSGFSLRYAFSRYGHILKSHMWIHTGKKFFNVLYVINCFKNEEI